MRKNNPFMGNRSKKVVPEEPKQFVTRLTSALPMKEKLTLASRRGSTVSNLRHDMWLLRLDEAIDRYLNEPRKHECVEVYQDLQSQGALTNWKLVEKDAAIIFVSHEWVG